MDLRAWLILDVYIFVVKRDKNTRETSLQAYLMKTSFELINGGLGFTALSHETRIHTNRNESRAYTRLLFRLIAGSRDSFRFVRIRVSLVRQEYLYELYGMVGFHVKNVGF